MKTTTDAKNHTMFYIYGKQPVFEALLSSHPVDKVILALESDRQYVLKTTELARKRNIEVDFMAKSKLQILTGAVLHQGALAQLPYYQYLSDQDALQLIRDCDKPLILILDQIQDPHNLGAKIRTAEVAGVTAIIIPAKSTAQINATVVKTSSGAVFHVPICRTYHLTSFLENLFALKVTLAAMVPGVTTSIYDADLTVSMALVIVSEGQGVRKNILKYCALKLAIPGMGRVVALNASVSTAIVLFEAVRQRRIPA